MKVIVCGAGQVGFNIARHLAMENNDVTVIVTPNQYDELIDELDKNKGSTSENFRLKMSKADVSDVIRFPEAPGVTSKVWSCSEQTGYCYVMHLNNFNIRTVDDLIDHHCYGADAKVTWINNAKFLKRV